MGGKVEDENALGDRATHRAREGLIRTLADLPEVRDALAQAPTEAAEAIDPAKTVNVRKAGTDSKHNPKRLRYIGRFRIEHELGSGGMGVVYAAHDEELGRRVAIKLLIGEATEGAEARMLQEAKAMAQLSHRNVVTVHDIGIHRGSAFIAMELVEGATLREWLDAGERGWREIATTFIAAGRGLQAAHEAGIVHRDFKPDNVLIDHDGQARVADFGLAGAGDGRTSADAAAENPLISLTATGAIMGTPAYMAPEQHLGSNTDERTDQFAFCVALFEALYKQRPFAGGSIAELATNVTSGAIRDSAEHRGVPKTVHAALIRGLQPRPMDRWPNMHGLLVELEANLTPRQRPWTVLGAGAAAAAVAVALFAFRSSTAPDNPGYVCQSPAEQWEGLWDDAIRSELQAKLLGTGLPYAAKTWTAFESELDRFTSKWSQLYGDSCTSDKQRADSLLYNQRLTCLQNKRHKMQSIVATMRNFEPTTLVNGMGLTLKLPLPEECAVDTIARAQPAPPDDAALDQAVQSQRARFDAAVLTANASYIAQDMGNIGDAIKVGLDAASQLEKLGYLPTVAEVQYKVGYSFLLGDTMPAEGRRRLARALEAAEEGGHDEFTAAALIALVRFQALANGYNFDQSAARLARAERLMRRVGSPIWLRSRWLVASAQHAVHLGDTARALELLATDRSAVNEAYGSDTMEAAYMLRFVPRIMYAAGAVGDAAAMDRHLESVALRTGGADHPEANLGPIRDAEALLWQGKTEDALLLLREDLDRLTSMNPAPTRTIAIERTMLGYQRFARGDMAEARGLARQAYEAIVAAAPANWQPRVYTTWLWAELSWAVGDFKSARAGAAAIAAVVDAATAFPARRWEADLLLDELDARDGKSVTFSTARDEAIAHVSTFNSWESFEFIMVSADAHRGNALWHMGKRNQALARYEAGMKRMADVEAPDMKQAWIFERVGTARLELGRAKDALQPLEASLGAASTCCPNHFFVPSAKFSLARALVATSADQRVRALQLAREARDGFEALGPGRSDDRDRVDAWLKRHGK